MCQERKEMESNKMLELKPQKAEKEWKTKIEAKNRSNTKQ